ncbi:MAG: hypothetical protein HOQ18_02890 [Dermatophilaceae bacterium]|nr:hypothetical protein [Dermatophilaceae bacterium]
MPARRPTAYAGRRGLAVTVLALVVALALVVCGHPVVDVMATKPLTAPFPPRTRAVTTEAQRSPVVEAVGATNGDVVSGAPLGVLLEDRFGGKRRPTVAEESCRVRTWGRLGDDRLLAPDGGPSVLVCRPRADGSRHETVLDANGSVASDGSSGPLRLPVPVPGGRSEVPGSPGGGFSGSTGVQPAPPEAPDAPADVPMTTTDLPVGS